MNPWMVKPTMWGSADVPRHAGTSLASPTIRPDTDPVLGGHFQVGNGHILREGWGWGEGQEKKNVNRWTAVSMANSFMKSYRQNKTLCWTAKCIFLATQVLASFTWDHLKMLFLFLFLSNNNLPWLFLGYWLPNNETFWGRKKKYLQTRLVHQTGPECGKRHPLLSMLLNWTF